MKTVFDTNIYRFEIQKSKFIGYIFHIEDTNLLKNKLKEIEKEFPKATHYCYAYSINGRQKNNDDNEPSGTAGSPIQEAIIKNGLDNVCVVVIRYFGGIKLGAGGLTRSYLTAALEVIKSSIIKEIVETQTYSLTYDYSLETIIKNYLYSKNIQIIDTVYDISIKCIIATNEDVSELINLTNGKIKIEKDEQIEIIK